MTKKDNLVALTPKKGKKLINWENGVPVSGYSPSLSTDQILKLFGAAASLEYLGEYDDNGDVVNYETRFQGMTNLEVAVVKQFEKAAAGDFSAMNLVLDRLIGKPKQTVESTTMNVSYQDYLAKLKEDEEKERNKADIVEGEYDAN